MNTSSDALSSAQGQTCRGILQKLCTGKGIFLLFFPFNPFQCPNSIDGMCNSVVDFEG